MVNYGFDKNNDYFGIGQMAVDFESALKRTLCYDGCLPFHTRINPGAILIGLWQAIR